MLAENLHDLPSEKNNELDHTRGGIWQTNFFIQGCDVKILPLKFLMTESPTNFFIKAYEFVSPSFPIEMF
jgi:hypothetical protein